MTRWLLIVGTADLSAALAELYWFTDTNNSYTLLLACRSMITFYPYKYCINENRWQLALHCHLKPPALPVVLHFNYEAGSKTITYMYQPTKFQQNWAMRGSVIDNSTIFQWPFLRQPEPESSFHFSQVSRPNYSNIAQYMNTSSLALLNVV